VTTVYVVPCGVSALDQLSRKLPHGGSAVTKFTREIDGGKWLNGVDLDDAPAVPAAWSAKVEARAKDAGLDDAPAKWLSAETHTLATRVTHGRLSPGQHVLLLASDTKDGLTAAFCVGQYLAGSASGLIGYISSPKAADGKWDLAVTRYPVTVIRVRGLKPAGSDFNLAALGIGMALRAACDLGAPVEVHLTGGYKATLLHTMAMTEVLYSMAPDRVSAWNVFEDVPPSGSGQPFAPGQPVAPGRIGLRAHRPEYLNLWRTELSGARDERNLGSRTLEGVGWTEDAAGKRRLTDFGWGYLAVLGDHASPRGDDNS